MEVILSRHGNTFNPTDKVVMAGLKNDLHLVEKGGQQAELLAQAFLKAAKRPHVVLCGELVRHRRYAEIVLEQLGLPPQPIIDPRLNELDYGGWTGLSDDEIIAQYGADAFENWQKRCVWPPANHQWGGSENEVRTRIKTFVDELKTFCTPEQGAEQTALVVSSGGTLRYFLQTVQGAFENALNTQTFKMKTGHIGKLRFHKNGDAEVVYWNINPADVVNGTVQL